MADSMQFVGKPSELMVRAFKNRIQTEFWFSAHPYVPTNILSVVSMQVTTQQTGKLN